MSREIEKALVDLVGLHKHLLMLREEADRTTKRVYQTERRFDELAQKFRESLPEGREIQFTVVDDILVRYHHGGIQMSTVNVIETARKES